ncbi:MAG: hypothetical protein ACR2MP_10880 [Streptosporangiaceae bacterium]
MQPLAVSAVALVVIMLAGVSVTLIWTRRNTQPLPGGMNRWQLHGCIPLGTSGLVLGAVSRGSGQAPATHQVLVVSASALLAGGLLCGLAGAVSGTRQQRAARQ